MRARGCTVLRDGMSDGRPRWLPDFGQRLSATPAREISRERRGSGIPSTVWSSSRGETLFHADASGYLLGQLDGVLARYDE
jgi:hypothetical protein